MHDEFADWYRPCTTGTESGIADLLSQRWQGIEKLTDQMTALDLVRITLQLAPQDATYLECFRSAFKKVDAAFPMSGNELELSLLAGSALISLLGAVDEIADEAALGLLCAAGIGRRSSPWLVPFVHNSQKYLDGRVRELRKQSKIATSPFNSKALGAHIDGLITKWAEPALAAEAAKQLFDALLKSLGAIVNDLADSSAELERQSVLRKEETDVLSWLTAAVSRDANKTFDDLNTPASSLIAAKELAELTAPPGIVAARSVLLSLIPPLKGKTAEKSFCLRSAVNATDRDWRAETTKAAESNGLLDLCPIVGAMKTSLSTDDSVEWVGAYKKAYGIDPTTVSHPIDLAMQMYNECLLTRVNKP